MHLGIYPLLVSITIILTVVGCATPPFAIRLQQAVDGDPSAQYDIAMVYDSGKGNTLRNASAHKDSVEAMRWLRKAAEGGNGRANLSIGLHYYYKDGVDFVIDFSNYDTAYHYFKIAEEKGVTDVFYWLGLCSLKGRGTAQNEKIAIDYFRKGAESPCDTAKYCMSEIAACYLYGYGVGAMRNYDECRKWYQMAADHGDQNAARFIEKKLTRDFYNQVGNAKKNDSNSQYTTTECERNGSKFSIKANLSPKADAVAVKKRIMDDLIAECENDLMLRERKLQREDVSWDFSASIKSGKAICILTWYYVKTLNYAYDSDSRSGFIVIDLANSDYGDAKDYILKNIKSICETKLVAIKDGKVPEGAAFEIGKEEMLPNGTLKVHFKTLQ